MIPAVLAAVGAGALLVALAAWRSHREMRRWLGADPGAARRGARAAMLTAGLAVVAVAWVLAALEPPRFSGAGVDVVVAVDVSRSMDARDVAPSRLRRALRLAERLVVEADGARLGLVLFAGDAFAALPLTLDRDAHLTYLRALDSEVISQRGSDLARALRVGLAAFDPRSARPRALVLLSDGEHAGGSLEAAAAELRSAGVRVAAVGFGTPEGEVVPGPRGEPLLDRRGNVILSRRSDPILERLAAATGGDYFREREDGPTSSQLLPPPAPGALPEQPPEPHPLRALLGAALALLGAELWLSSAPARSGRSGSRTRPRALLRRRLASCAGALVAAGWLGCGPGGWVEQGDEHLARGEVQKALSLYRRSERSYGSTPDTRLRIGNALYRQGELDRAAAAYLDALRRIDLEATEARFVATFNLGNTLLERERFEEARDSFWNALLERPESLAAKFNYEWAAERARPLELPAPPDAAPAPGASAEQSRPGEADFDPDPAAASPSPARRADLPRSRERAELTASEAERWLGSIADEMDAPLRRQLSEALGAPQPRRRGGQTW